MKYSLPSDLWSAGVMAYQLVTGRLPFSGEEGEEVSTRYMQTQRFDHKVRLLMQLGAPVAHTVFPPWVSLHSLFAPLLGIPAIP